MNSGQLDIKTLPFVTLEALGNLPETCGIYFAIEIETGEILYIGRTENFRKRWQAHHRLTELRGIGQIKIAWLEICPDQHVNIHAIEREAIETFAPRMNNTTAVDGPIAIRLQHKHRVIIAEALTEHPELGTPADFIKHLLDREKERNEHLPEVSMLATSGFLDFLGKTEKIFTLFVSSLGDSAQS